MLTHAFDTLGAARVVWHTDIYNERSQAAIARLGATREGELRKHRIRRDGSWRTTVQYSMTDDDWPAAREKLRPRWTNTAELDAGRRAIARLRIKIAAEWQGEQMAQARIGISGWLYPPWRRCSTRGPAAPPRAGVPVRQAGQRRDQRHVLLAAAAVELPQLARPDARRLRLRGQGRPVHHAHEEAGATSRRRWRTSSPPGVLALREKLGPVLWQLPPKLGFDAERLAAFFALLPRSTAEAALARATATTSG